MAIRQKRGDTLVGSIERQYDVDFGVHGSMKLDTLRQMNGGASLSTLVERARVQAATPRVFLSYDWDDRQQVQGFRLLKHNPNFQFEFNDGSLRAPINSYRAPYVKQKLREKISRCSVTVCLIGSRTYASEWVDWEVIESVEQGKGLLGIRLKGSGGNGPPSLREARARIIDWEPEQFEKQIRRAALRR